MTSSASSSALPSGFEMCESDSPLAGEGWGGGAYSGWSVHERRLHAAGTDQCLDERQDELRLNPQAHGVTGIEFSIAFARTNSGPAFGRGCHETGRIRQIGR